ncbi:hypothetical protein JP0096_08230 [Helicobacter pylori]|nr:hypothetical protein JP0096_08230 [Helicobacter pylori]
MKPQDIKIVQSVLEVIKEPIKVTEVYDKAKELFEKARLKACLIMGATLPIRVLALLFIQP